MMFAVAADALMNKYIAINKIIKYSASPGAQFSSLIFSFIDCYCRPVICHPVDIIAFSILARFPFKVKGTTLYLQNGYSKY
jgi:hypothetical protein